VNVKYTNKVLDEQFPHGDACWRTCLTFLACLTSNLMLQSDGLFAIFRVFSRFALRAENSHLAKICSYYRKLRLFLSALAVLPSKGQLYDIAGGHSSITFACSAKSGHFANRKQQIVLF